MNNFNDLLKKHGIKPSLNRVMIYEFIYNTHTHPTVDEIFSSIRKKNSVLSKMTVYSVLAILKDAGLIREVKIDDKEIRYDIKTRDHGHFKCKKCNTIIDFDVDMESIGIGEITGCSIEQKDVYFYGICDKCRANKT